MCSHFLITINLNYHSVHSKTEAQISITKKGKYIKILKEKTILLKEETSDLQLT